LLISLLVANWPSQKGRPRSIARRTTTPTRSCRDQSRSRQRPLAPKSPPFSLDRPLHESHGGLRTSTYGNNVPWYLDYCNGECHFLRALQGAGANTSAAERGSRVLIRRQCGVGTALFQIYYYFSASVFVLQISDCVGDFAQPIALVDHRLYLSGRHKLSNGVKVLFVRFRQEYH